MESIKENKTELKKQIMERWLPGAGSRAVGESFKDTHLQISPRDLMQYSDCRQQNHIISIKFAKSLDLNFSHH